MEDNKVVALKPKTMKYYAFGEDKPPIYYRPGTSDESIIQTVLIDQKEYLLPQNNFLSCFDIGANIGVVSVIMAVIYPNAKIYAFEPVKENFELLKLNTAPYPNVQIFNCGLGNKPGQKKIFKSDDKTNLGGYSTHIEGEEGEEITIVRMAKICHEIGVPELIKIDCEGAEHEILTDIPGIEKVKWITGELHGIDDFVLLNHLSKHFKISGARGFNDKVWHFHAASKTWTDFGREAPLQ